MRKASKEIRVCYITLKLTWNSSVLREHPKNWNWPLLLDLGQWGLGYTDVVTNVETVAYKEIELDRPGESVVDPEVELDDIARMGGGPNTGWRIKPD